MLAPNAFPPPPPPPKAVVLDAGAVVDDKAADADAPLDAVVVEAKGDCVEPPIDAPKPPNPNDVPEDDGAGADDELSSSGLAILYFCDNLANIACSLPC